MRYFLVSILVFSLSLTACGRKASPENGAYLAVLYGCAACHSPDGTKKIAPTWQGLYNSEVPLADGSTVIADEEYLTESITTPSARIVAGYTEGAMPLFTLTEEEVADLVAYIETLSP